MQEPYWWYVLFVRSNTEKRVISDIDDFSKANKLTYEVQAFVPESEYYYRNKKYREMGKLYRKRPLFPGYVFIETNMDSQEFMKVFAHYIRNSADIIKLLRYGDEYLKDIKRDASGDGTKIKVKETELVVSDAQAYETAKNMVDLREDQIERYQDLLKEQKSLSKRK